LGIGNAYPNGAILVTPDAGPVVIDGTAILGDEWGNAGLTIHQYSTNALTINAQIYDGNGTCLTNTGPGELVLTSPDSRFDRLRVLEGTLTCDSIRDAGQPCSLGLDGGTYSRRLVLGDATLKYVGAGDETNRRFVMRGFGVVEASGSGPLVFTDGEPVIVSYISGNQLLTLSGETEGVITGSLNGLQGGRIQKRGNGKWTLTGDTSIIWGADVLEGVLVVDGSLGRDITVHANGTLAGRGTVQRDLAVEGGTLFLDPAAPMTVGKNLVIGEGAALALPAKITNTDFLPVLTVAGKITGEFSNLPANAIVRYDGNSILAKTRGGTLFLLK
jgi:hypothetical protein